MSTTALLIAVVVAGFWRVLLGCCTVSSGRSLLAGMWMGFDALVGCGDGVTCWPAAVGTMEVFGITGG